MKAATLIAISGTARLALFCSISALSSSISISLPFSWDCMSRSFARYISRSAEYSTISCKRHCTAFVPVASSDDICDISRTIFIWHKVFFSNSSTSFVTKPRISGTNFAPVLTDDRVDERIAWCALLAMADSFCSASLTFSLTIFSIGMSKVISWGFGTVTVEVVDFAIDLPSLAPSSISTSIFVFNSI